MISINRAIASILPFVYALYLPVQSMNVPGFTTRYLEIAALVLYVYCAAATLLFFRGLQLPRWQAAINLISGAALPTIVIVQRELIDDHSIGAWVVMGTALILTGTAVRQQPRFALIGLALLLGVLTYEVKGNFNVSHNRLSSTKFSPKRIGGAYNISHNKIFDLTDYPIVNQGTIHHGNTLSISDINMIIMLIKYKQIDFGLALSLAFENLTAYGQELLKPFLDKNHEKYKKLNDIGVI